MIVLRQVLPQHAHSYMHGSSLALPEACPFSSTTVVITLHSNYLFAHQVLSAPPPPSDGGLPALSPLVRKKAWLLVDLNSLLLNEVLMNQ